MKFDSAASILTSIGQMQWASQQVQGNRAKINRLFNGDPPWTEDERKANRLNTCFNWLEGTRIAANARAQIYNAFFQPGDFFSIKLDSYSKVPPHKRDEWSTWLTTNVNRELRRCRKFRSALEQSHAQVVLHGPGPILWRKSHLVAPDTLGVDDVIVPAGTLADMSNLDCLAIYSEWTWPQLYDLTHGDAVDAGWNKAYVEKLLAALYKQPLQPLYQGNRWLFPEKISEDVKENAALYAASALGRVLAWDFYYRNEETNQWNRRILLDYNNITPESIRNELEREQPDFLYEKDNYADDWQHIIHWFVGNCSNVAPFRYYSIRSIGYLLYGVCYVQNMMRNRLTDHMLQALLTWFRNVSEDDRERLVDIQLQHLGIFPDGLSIVNAQERYTADYQLITMGLNQNRQLMAESATSFLPDVAVEGEKPAMTATESLIRNNASVTLTSAVQTQLYNQAESFYREICRRICLADKRDPMVDRLLKGMDMAEVPREVLDVDTWEISPNRVMGGGNRAVELTTSRALFEIRGALGAQGASQATRKYVLALTNNADEARALVPDEPEVSDASLLAASAFGTLMTGVPFPMKPGVNEIDYIETLIQQAAQAAAPLEQLQQNEDAIAVNAERIAGLVNVVQHIEGHVQVLAMDEMQKERVRDYQRLLSQFMQQLRAYGERLSEMEQAAQEQAGQGGVSPEAQAKIVSSQILAQTKAQIQAETAAQKRQHKDAAFIGDQERKDAATLAEIKRKEALTQAELAATDLTTSAQLIHDARKAALERQNAAQEARETSDNV